MVRRFTVRLCMEVTRLCPNTSNNTCEQGTYPSEAIGLVCRDLFFPLKEKEGMSRRGVIKSHVFGCSQEIVFLFL